MVFLNGDDDGGGKLLKGTKIQSKDEQMVKETLHVPHGIEPK